MNQLKGRNFGDEILNAMADGIRKVLLKTGGIAGRNEADCFYLYVPHMDVFTDKMTVDEAIANYGKY